jgi:phenylacetate-CoA ligase
MDLLNQIYLSAFLPLYEAQRFSGLRKRWRELERSERATIAQNRKTQWEALQQMMRHAYETVPFYRRRFDEHGLSPASIQGPGDLRRLPALTRDDMRGHRDNLISDRYRGQRLQQAITGGTTETPVSLVRDWECVRKRNAVQLRFHAWAGNLPGDKMMLLWGAQTDFPAKPSWRWRTFDRYVMRRIWAPTAVLTEEVLERYRLDLNRFRPDTILAYPTSLAMFCRYLVDCGRAYHVPKSAMVTAEPLLEEQREIVRRAFGYLPYLQYGTRDFGMVAAECECHDGLHVNPSSVYMEFDPLPGSAEGLHEIIVTDLTNLAMPMLRYRINDCTLLGEEQCPCGRGYPLMREIEGRVTDNFYLADGTVVMGVALPGRVLKASQGIRKMQIIQETHADFHVRFVPSDKFVNDDLAGLGENLKRYVGPVNIRFEQVDDIPRERSGKSRFCISRVGPGRTVEAGRSE